MLARAVGDDALAVLGQRVLLRDPAHARERPVLLVVAVDQEVVRAIAQGHEARSELGHLAVSAFLELGALLVGKRPFRVPCIDVDPAGFVGDRHPGVAEVSFTGHGRGRDRVRRQHELGDAPVQVLSVRPARAADHEADLVLEDRELRHRVVAQPA